MVSLLGSMAGLKNKKALSIDPSVYQHTGFRAKLDTNIVQPKIHKKYLGEADDLHFIPDSPLIERQFLTEQEEGELKRVCALALAQVPHSDDMTDDPFQYIAAQVQVKPAPETAISEQVKSEDIRVPLPEVPAIPIGTDTATPSDVSKRDTMDRTDYSTPLTSAGITPGETAKRFSDAGKRASSSKGSSHLKHESAQARKSRAASSSHSMPRKSNDAGIRKSHEARKPSGDHKAAERTVRVVQDAPRHTDVNSRSTEITRPVRYSQLELNKKLPPLPPSATEPTKQAPISRMMKTIKKKKSQILDGRSLSMSASSTPPLPTTIPDLAKPRHKSVPAARLATELPPVEPKRKFRLRFFGGKKESPPQDIAVA
jgi:hypothetical protein